MDQNFKVHIIDLFFKGQPHGIAAFLVESTQGLVLVETGPHSTFEQLCNEVTKLGLDPKSIKHVLLTHIHLDHAGAAWAFAENGANIYLHPFGFRHMHNPEKLLASVKMIYKERTGELWGTLKPISSEQLIVMEDMQEIEINGLKFTAYYTPGHAKHHIAWGLGNVVFTGDVTGISIKGGPVVPPCPPPDINIEEWLFSIERLRKLKGIEVFYLTHFGMVKNIESHLLALEKSLKDFSSFIRPYFEKNINIEEAVEDFKVFSKKYLTEKGLNDDEAETYEIANPSSFNVYGLMRYWQKKLSRVE